MTPILRIANWKDLYENNRTRELKSLTWVPVPNRHDGHGYAMILSLKNGPALYGAWQVILQVASRCEPRGTLVREGGKPHTASSLALMTRFPVDIMEECIKACMDGEIGWIECENANESNIPAHSCGHHAGSSVNTALPCLEWKGMEGNGREEEKAPPRYSEEVVGLLRYLNEKTSSKFQETETNLKLISCRLKEAGVDVAGMKAMIDRQCKVWLHDPKMVDFLRPATLFGKEKFAGYYGQRDKPILTQAKNGFSPPTPTLGHAMRNESDHLDPRANFGAHPEI